MLSWLIASAMPFRRQADMSAFRWLVWLSAAAEGRPAASWLSDAFRLMLADIFAPAPRCAPSRSGCRRFSLYFLHFATFRHAFSQSRHAISSFFAPRQRSPPGGFHVSVIRLRQRRFRAVRTSPRGCDNAHFRRESLCRQQPPSRPRDIERHYLTFS